MGLYDTQGTASGLNATFTAVKKHALTDFPSGEIARAKLRLVKDKTVLDVQFNPQTLTISSSVQNETQVSVAGTEQTTITYAIPNVTLSVELLFDALTNEGMVEIPQNLLNPFQAQASKVFPKSTKSVIPQLEFFYEMMANFSKRKIEFAWNQFHFEGYAEDVKLNVTLFDEAGDPTRAQVSLSIKKQMEKVSVPKSALSLSGKTDIGSLTRR